MKFKEELNLLKLDASKTQKELQDYALKVIITIILGLYVTLFLIIKFI